jgi:hypothetical protein
MTPPSEPSFQYSFLERKPIQRRSRLSHMLVMAELTLRGLRRWWWWWWWWWCRALHRDGRGVHDIIPSLIQPINVLRNEKAFEVPGSGGFLSATNFSQWFSLVVQFERPSNKDEPSPGRLHSMWFSSGTANGDSTLQSQNFSIHKCRHFIYYYSDSI